MRSYSRFTIIGKTVDRPAQMYAASGKELPCLSLMVDVSHGGEKSSRFTCEAWNEARSLLANIAANQPVLITGSIKVNTFQTSRGSSFSRTALYLDDCQALGAPKPISPDLLTPTSQEASEDYPF